MFSGCNSTRYKLSEEQCQPLIYFREILIWGRNMKFYEVTFEIETLVSAWELDLNDMQKGVLLFLHNLLFYMLWSLLLIDWSFFKRFFGVHIKGVL